MQIKHIGQKKAPRAVCAFCGTQLDLPDTFKRESDLAQDPGFSSSPQTDGITDQIHRDGHLEVEDSASIPPEVQDLVVILKNKGFKGIDTDFLQKLLSSGISLTVDQENSDPDMLTGSQQIHSDPPGDSHSSSSKMIPFESERSDTGMLVGLLNRLGIAGPKPPPVGRLDLSALMKTALPPDQSQKCPNKTCGAMIPKDAKRCPWCGREF